MGRVCRLTRRRLGLCPRMIASPWEAPEWPGLPYSQSPALARPECCPSDQEAAPRGAPCKSLGSSREQPRALRKCVCWRVGVEWGGNLSGGSRLPGEGVGADQAPIRGKEGSRPTLPAPAGRLPGASGSRRPKQRPREAEARAPLELRNAPPTLLNTMGERDLTGTSAFENGPQPCPQAEPRPPSSPPSKDRDPPNILH